MLRSACKTTVRMRTLIQNTACSGRISKFTVTSPIGDIEISSCDEGLHAVHQCGADDSTFAPDERQPVMLKPGQQGTNIMECAPANSCYVWLQNYFTHRMASPVIPPLCSAVVKTDSFCAKAIQLLPEAAPLGKTLTYKELAELCGNAKACRAAGHAMATNPVSLLIPCHRVVSSHGGPGNYAHGKKNSVKVWLLNFEKGSDVKCF